MRIVESVSDEKVIDRLLEFQERIQSRSDVEEFVLNDTRFVDGNLVVHFTLKSTSLQKEDIVRMFSGITGYGLDKIKLDKL